jgi:hypothetical protein
MIQVHRFKADDYDQATNRNSAWMGDWKALREKEGKSFTFKNGREVIACAGVTPFWPGTAEAWLVHDERFYKYIRDITALSGSVLEWLQIGVRHLFCDTLARDEKARAYLNHYGFVATGFFDKFTEDGDDVVRYSRVVE